MRFHLTSLRRGVPRVSFFGLAFLGRLLAAGAITFVAAFGAANLPGLVNVARADAPPCHTNGYTDLAASGINVDPYGQVGVVVLCGASSGGITDRYAEWQTVNGLGAFSNSTQVTLRIFAKDSHGNQCIDGEFPYIGSRGTVHVTTVCAGTGETGYATAYFDYAGTQYLTNAPSSTRWLNYLCASDSVKRLRRRHFSVRRLPCDFSRRPTALAKLFRPSCTIDRQEKNETGPDKKDGIPYPGSMA